MSTLTARAAVALAKERDEWKARAESAIADVSRLLRERDEGIARAERAEAPSR